MNQSQAHDQELIRKAQNPRAEIDQLRADLARVTSEFSLFAGAICNALGINAPGEDVLKNMEEIVRAAARVTRERDGLMTCLNRRIDTLDAVLSLTINQRDEAVAQVQRLREAVANAASLLRRIAADEKREGKSPMAATKGAEAAEAAIKEESEVEYNMNRYCPHCGGDPKVRNPTGECDHLYFPENVNKDLNMEERK